MSEVEKLLSMNRKAADRYLKREVLGEGTYGVVYKAIDTKVTFFFFFVYTFVGISFGVFGCVGFRVYVLIYDGGLDFVEF